MPPENNTNSSADELQNIRKTLLSAKTATYILIAVIFASVLFLTGLGVRELKGSDENRVAGIASETAIYGNWVIPRLNNQDFLEKPPLYFWCAALAFKTFGRNEFAAKLTSAIMAAIGALSLFACVRKMGYSNFAALLSLIVLSTSMQYFNYGRSCVIDMMLAAFIICAMYCFQGLSKAKSAKGKIVWHAGFTLALGAAVFTKGLVGLAIPASALGIYLLVATLRKEEFKNIFRRDARSDIKSALTGMNIVSWIALFSAAALCFIPLSIWLYYLFQSAGFTALKTVVWTNNFGRFTGGHAEHIEPFYYYLKKLPEQLQPWTIFLPFAVIWHIARAYKEKNTESLFLLCWLFVPYALLTVSAGKRPLYVLPLYAAEAAMIGTFLAYLIEQMDLSADKKAIIPVILKSSTILLITLFFVAPFIFLGIASYFKVHSPWAFILPGVLLAAAVYATVSIKKKHAGKTLIAFAACILALFLSIDVCVMGAMCKKYSFKKMFEFAAEQTRNQGSLVLYQPDERIRGAAVFYLGKVVDVAPDSSDLATMAKSATRPRLFLARKEAFEQLENVTSVKTFKIKRKVFVFFRKTSSAYDGEKI